MLIWKELYNECSNCHKCKLADNRINMVFGEGNVSAKLMFVGEAPGADEDRLGRPFVGRAGQLLTKGLEALGLTRDRDYYIANVCKCRPEKNRTPYEDEARACIGYLRNQFALVKPKIVVCLGATAMKFIMEPAISKLSPNLLENKYEGAAIEDEWKSAVQSGEMRITRDRGKWIKINNLYMMSTFHPAALFRDESKKKLFWEDLKKIKIKYDEV
ncbi:uracil-DNA glycosylase [Clostridium hydrogenum]|uniref:uracil-DNA glycosylase n=1 Tax=Clostridium hydrogenum TaxID=2855764 RepID=UPI001F239574|nr:uracil-DNA glycosylase [Clostridium hydrogenum]